MSIRRSVNSGNGRVAQGLAEPAPAQESGLASTGARGGMGEAITRYGAAAQRRLEPCFRGSGVAYPPERAALLAFKAERRLELWARDSRAWIYVKRYRILAASGEAGPKLREGDRQVPEGIYRIVRLNPHSRFHLSMKLDYPNSFDLRYAASEGRRKPGNDIFIHGKARSAGCVAVGDPAIEELFVLVHALGIDNTRVLIAPRDLRWQPLSAGAAPRRGWVMRLYEILSDELGRFPPENAGT